MLLFYQVNSMEKSPKKRRKMKKTAKKFLLISVGIIITIILVFIIIKNNKSEDKIVYNKNESFVKTQSVEGRVFKNIKCSYDGKDSLLSYTMVNETEKKIYLNSYDVIVKDKKNVQLTKIAARVAQTFEPKKTVKMANQVVGVDLTDAYYMELKLNTNKKGK